MEEALSGPLTQTGNTALGTLLSESGNRLAISLTVAAASVDGNVSLSQVSAGPGCTGSAKLSGPATTSQITLTLSGKTGSCDWADQDEIALRRQ